MTHAKEAAQALWRDAQAVLHRILDEGLLRAKPATRSIRLQRAARRSRSRRQTVLNGLSFCASNAAKPACLADYIASADDYLGLFWVTAGIGLDELVDAYEAQGDTYSALIAKAWADRFAESLAEWLHREVRTTYWGFVADETLSVDELLAERYQIRPAPGYPACPDHRHKANLVPPTRRRTDRRRLERELRHDPGSERLGFLLRRTAGALFQRRDDRFRTSQ